MVGNIVGNIFEIEYVVNGQTEKKWGNAIAKDAENAVAKLKDYIWCEYDEQITILQVIQIH